MPIERVKTYVIETPPPHRGGYSWTILKLVTDDGTEVLGEAYGVPFDPDVTARLMRDIGKRHVIGREPYDIEDLRRSIYVGGADTHTPHHPDLTTSALISAFEMACLDIVGTELGQPVYNLLGGRVHDRLRSHTYLYPDDDAPEDSDVFRDPEHAARRAEAYLDMGFTAVKFDPVTPMKPDFPQQIPLSERSRAAEVVRSVREAVGNECEILIGTRAAVDLERDQVRRDDRGVPPALVRGARPAGEQGRDGQGGQGHRHPGRDWRAAGDDLRVPRTARGGCRLDPPARDRAGRRDTRGEESRWDGRVPLRPPRPAPLGGTGGGRRERPARRLQPQLPDPGVHRAPRRLPRGTARGAHRVGGRLRHPTDRPRPGDRTGRGRRGRARPAVESGRETTRSRPVASRRRAPADGSASGRREGVDTANGVAVVAVEPPQPGVSDAGPASGDPRAASPVGPAGVVDGRLRFALHLAGLEVPVEFERQRLVPEDDVDVGGPELLGANVEGERRLAPRVPAVASRPRSERNAFTRGWLSSIPAAFVWTNHRHVRRRTSASGRRPHRPRPPRGVRPGRPWGRG